MVGLDLESNKLLLGCQHPFAPGGLVYRDPARVAGLIHNSAGGAVQRLEAGEQVSNLSGHKPCGSTASQVSVLNGTPFGQPPSGGGAVSQPHSFYAALSDIPLTELRCITQEAAVVACNMHVLCV